jgi:atypical dual specificity phosphatase
LLLLQHDRFYLDSVRENLVSALPNRASLEQREQTRIVVQHLALLGLDDLSTLLEGDAVSLPVHLQRALLLARALLRKPALLMADETTAGLSDQAAEDFLELLKQQATQRSILFVTHNQRHARAVGGQTVLLAGGRVIECTPTAEFFAAPRSKLGAQFVRTGGCVVPSEELDSNDEGEAASPEPAPPGPQTAASARGAPSRFVGPRGFFWIEPGRLGGTPRPGIVERVEQDVEGLRRLGVSVLVNLEEHKAVSPELLESQGIRSVHFPIVDMSVPELPPTVALVRQVAGWLGHGDVVAYHCRAGLGRTGTLLACQLIAGGESARGALHAVRAINPRCVQSDVQVAFLPVFEARFRDVSHSTQT